MSVSLDTNRSGNSPQGDADPQEKPPKDGAYSGAVILGRSWYHHLKRLEAKRRAGAESTRDQAEQDGSD